MIFLPSYFRMRDLQQTNQDYKQQIRQLAQKNDELVKERERLIEDPTYLEKVAREKMGLGRKGEVILRLTPMNESK